jgi:hypothetical protein
MTPYNPIHFWKSGAKQKITHLIPPLRNVGYNHIKAFYI